MVNCVTCRKRKHWESVDCGHFRSRSCHATRFLLENTAPQCKYCNGLQGKWSNPNKDGIILTFAAAIDLEWGPGTSQRIMDTPECKKTRQELLSLSKSLWDDLVEAGFDNDAYGVVKRFRAAALEAGIVI